MRTRESVREILLKRLGVHEYVGKKTLVIRRINPIEGHYKHESAGAMRRYMVNHSRIVDRLRESGHDLEEVTLDQMTMAEQRAGFGSRQQSSRSTVPAKQHLFLPPGCRVIELGANRRRHFVRIAESLDSNIVTSKLGRQARDHASPTPWRSCPQLQMKRVPTIDLTYTIVGVVRSLECRLGERSRVPVTVIAGRGPSSSDRVVDIGNLVDRVAGAALFDILA